jgi:hypothetical protein
MKILIMEVYPPEFFKRYWVQIRGRDSSADIVMGYGLDGRSLIPGRGKGFFSTPQRPDWLWCASSLLANVYRRLFPRG